MDDNIHYSIYNSPSSIYSSIWVKLLLNWFKGVEGGGVRTMEIKFADLIQINYITVIPVKLQP